MYTIRLQVLVKPDKPIFNYTSCPNFHFRLVCRCLEKLNKLSDGDLSIYNQFTLENYGECWSSRTGYDSLHSFTRANSCVGAGFLDCNTSTMSECTGSNLASFLYQVNNRTKLLGEHCEIVKKIVCLSSTIPLNSSTTFLGKTTVFQSFETSRMDSTVSPSWQTVLRNTTKTQKLTSSQNLKSTAVLNNTSEIILSEHYGKPSSTIEAMATEILALKTSSPDVLKESAGQKLSYQTYSLLSQMQTLNTGKLYTSGSKILNMTLAPTQFFITSSLRSIGNVSSVESTSSFSETSERSSRTNSVMLSSNVQGTSNKDTSSATGHTTSRETTIQTSKLNFALSSINTNPIEATSIVTSRPIHEQNQSSPESSAFTREISVQTSHQILRQNLSVSESQNKITSTLLEITSSSAFLNQSSTAISAIIPKSDYPKPPTSGSYQINNTSKYAPTAEETYYPRLSTGVPDTARNSSSTISMIIQDSSISIAQFEKSVTLTASALTNLTQINQTLHSSNIQQQNNASTSREVNVITTPQSIYINANESSRLSHTSFTSLVEDSFTTYGNFVYSTTSKIGGTTSPPSQQNITTTILLQSDIVMSTLSKSRQLNNGNVSATEIYNSSFLQQSREVTSTSQYDGTKKSTSKLETSQIEASYTKTQANHERSTISTFKNNSTSYLTSITSSTLSSTSFEQTQIRQSTLNENKVSNELTTKESKTIPAQQSKSKNLNNPSVKGNSAAAQSSSIYRMIAIHLIFINLLQLLKQIIRYMMLSSR